MITHRQRKIVEYLVRAKTWVKGSELSNVLNVTDRTVRNDINAVKKEYGEDIIFSCRGEGYKYNFDRLDVNDFVEEDEFMDSADRIIYLSKSLIINSEGIDIYDIQEELFISESTTEADIIKLKKLLRELYEDKITLIRERENLKIEISNEKYATNLLYNIVKYENPQFIIEDLQKYFKIDIELLIHSVKEVFNNNKYYSRYISFKSFILWLGVKIEQMKYSNTEEYNTSKDYIGILCSDLKSSIDKNFNVTLNSKVMDKLYNFFTNISELELKEEEIRKIDITKDYIYDFYQNIFEEMKEEYSLDIGLDKNIIHDIALHTRIALERIKMDIPFVNPLKDEIKNKYIFLFNLGIGISKKLYKLTGVEFNADEIAYLVAYLAGAVSNMNRDKLVEDKINILLIVPQGKSNYNYIYSQILNLKESNKLNIIGISSLRDIEIINEDQYDLVISTDNQQVDKYKSDIVVSPKFNIIDQISLRNLIKNKIKQLEKKEFSSMFNTFFKEELFIKNLECTTKEECIDELTNVLKEKGYSDEDFKKSVLEREKQLSTSIDTGIALPHATEIKANNTGIAVGILKHNINWSGNKVKVVLVFATKRDDMGQLNDMYRYIASLCMKSEYIEEIRRCNKFEKFEKLMKDYYLKESL